MGGKFINFLIFVIAVYCLLRYIIPYFRRVLRGKNVQYIEPKALEEEMKKRDMLLIDIRSSTEFYNMFGHIDKAINIPFDGFISRLGETADKLAGFKDTPVVVMGLRDENRVFLAYKALKEKGFSDISILNYGVSQWLREGLPTVERNVKKI